MSDLTGRIAQEIWQAYVVETGRSIPEGLAGKMAKTLVASLQLTNEPGWLSNRNDVLHHAIVGWVVADA